MLQKKQHIKILFLCFMLMIFFSACRKKYPENKGIHLKKAENRILGSYHITEYTVNGTDSMPLLTAKFKQDISQIEWEFLQEDKEYAIYKLPYENGYADILYEFRNNKTELFINYFIDPATITPSGFYNFFGKNLTTWKILKLYTKNKKPTLRIKRETGRKIYIIQFN